MKVLFWGLPFGVSERLIYICEGSMEDYAMMGSTEAGDLEPWTDGRTNFVMIP